MAVTALTSGYLDKCSLHAMTPGRLWMLSQHTAKLAFRCVAPRTNGVTAEQADCAAQRPVAEVAALQGTSMATPLAAGSAALVRQYFLEGFYPSGAATPAAAFAPSGVLVKAVMLGVHREHDVFIQHSNHCWHRWPWSAGPLFGSTAAV